MSSVGQEVESSLPEQLETDAQVIAKVEVVDHVNNVQLLVLVLLAQLVQYFDFNHALLVEACFVAYNFNRNHVATLVIDSFDN